MHSKDFATLRTVATMRGSLKAQTGKVVETGSKLIGAKVAIKWEMQR